MLRYAFALVLFAAAGASAWTLSPRLADLAEARYAAQVDAALHAGGYRWARGKVDGLTVVLSGPAPSDVAAGEALKIAAAISPVLTIVDEISAAPKVPPTIIPPRLEILKGEDSLTLTGVIANEAMVQALDANAQMLTFGAAPFPADWAATAPILRDIAERLQHARITLDDDALTIAGLAATQAARIALQTHLSALTSLGWSVEAAIDAPPPVLPDFKLRISRMAEDVAISCAAATQADAKVIEAEARAHLGINSTCNIGAGAPDAAWAKASTAVLAALAKVPAGHVEMAGKVVSMTALPPTTKAEANAAKQNLSASLPPGYRLTIDERALEEAGVPQVAPFRLTIDWPGGNAPLTIATTQAKTGFDEAAPILSAYARAHFPGVEANLNQIDGAAPPAGWRLATRTALEALSHLERGSVIISTAEVTLTGKAASLTALRTAHETLMQADEPWRATSRITHDPGRVATAQPVPSSSCASDVAGVIAEAPLSFQPASTTLTPTAKTTVDRIAAILTQCQSARFEIGGHTDAQGSETGNLALSRNRAEAVLTALTSTNAAPDQLVAKGYGEARPIAPNNTAAGRAQNRRIEFTLIEDPE